MSFLEVKLNLKEQKTNTSKTTKIKQVNERTKTKQEYNKTIKIPKRLKHPPQKKQQQTNKKQKWTA